MVPHGDDQWFDVVKTVMAILIYGEAFSITSDSVPGAATGETVKDRLLGFEGSFGQESLGLDMDVAQNVLKAVGNYGEIYDRNLGPSGINLPREGRAQRPLGRCLPARTAPRADRFTRHRCASRIGSVPGAGNLQGRAITRPCFHGHSAAPQYAEKRIGMVGFSVAVSSLKSIAEENRHSRIVGDVDF